MLPKLIAIVGPTAAGKSALGIQLAKRFDGEVLSVDSRQIYRGMNIGTAKPAFPPLPSAKGGSAFGGKGGLGGVAVDGVTHFGFDLVDPTETYSVADFKTYADKIIQEILDRKHVPFLVGGTGLWLRAIIDNLDLTQTAPDPALRSKLEKQSLDELVAKYLAHDPEGADIVDLKNKRRVIRALEVTLKTGKPFSQQLSRGEPKYDVLQIGLLVDRDELKARIDRRVDEMMSAGFLDEVRHLNDSPLPSAKGGSASGGKGGLRGVADVGGGSSAIGYRELLDHLDGHMTLNESIAKIKTATHQFAKRQMTWFKRDARIHWINDPQDAENLVRTFLKNP